MNKYNFISAALMILVGISQVSCNLAESSAREKEESEMLPENIVELRDDQIKLANIEIGKIEARSMAEEIRVNGKIIVPPGNHAVVCAPLGGYVVSASLMTGDFIRRGESIAMIENLDFIEMQQQFLETKSRLDYATAEFDRHSDLYKDQVYSEKNFQQVESEYKILKAQFNALVQKLLLTGIDPAGLTEDKISRSVSLKAPITGYITAANIQNGMFVTPTDILFEIVSNDKPILELTLFEKDAARVASEQKVLFFINNESEQHEAVIYKTGKSVDPDKLLKAYAIIIQPCANILPGMYVNGSIRESSDVVFALPSEAVVSFDDRFYIFIFEKNKMENGNPFTEYRMIEVGKGVTDDGYTEIILPEGFDAPSAKVVVKGAYNLLSAKKNAGEMAC